MPVEIDMGKNYCKSVPAIVALEGRKLVMRTFLISKHALHTWLQLQCL